MVVISEVAVGIEKTLSRDEARDSQILGSKPLFLDWHPPAAALWPERESD